MPTDPAELFAAFDKNYKSNDVPDVASAQFPQSFEKLNEMRKHMEVFLNGKDLSAPENAVYLAFNKFLDKGIEMKRAAGDQSLLANVA